MLRRLAGPVILMLACAAAAAPPPPFVANGGEAMPGRLHVGKTGIMCARLPCPHRGVFVATVGGVPARDKLLYADLDGKAPPPPMIGDPAALRRIEQAWKDRACLAIDGRLIPGEDDRPVLRVDRVVGSCGESA